MQVCTSPHPHPPAKTVGPRHHTSPTSSLPGTTSRAPVCVVKHNFPPYFNPWQSVQGLCACICLCSSLGVPVKGKETAKNVIRSAYQASDKSHGIHHEVSARLKASRHPSVHQAEPPVGAFVCMCDTFWACASSHHVMPYFPFTHLWLTPQQPGLQ